MTNAESNKKIIESYFLTMWNKRDTALTDTLVAENYVHHKPDGDVHGRDHIKNVMKIVLAKYPDIQFTLKHILAEGEMVSTYLEGKGTDKETGKITYFKEAFFHRILDGKIVEGWIIFAG
ncbi:MAG TPA: ester cyclase [Gammaproteobacteria bacterium]|nr:ester cyclase [Gammaproteobacteria bacterium]